MPDRTDFLKVYHRQESGFRGWLADYYQAALYLDFFERQIGKENLEEWLAENCPGVDWSVCQDMLHKLHHTPTGKKILATNPDPDHFQFPS